MMSTHDHVAKMCHILRSIFIAMQTCDPFKEALHWGCWGRRGDNDSTNNPSSQQSAFGEQRRARDFTGRKYKVIRDIVTEASGICISS